MAKMFFHGIRSPDELTIMRAPVRTQKMHKQRAKAILESAEADNIFEGLGKHGQIIFSLVIGTDESKDKWKRVEITNQYAIRLKKDLSDTFS